MFDFLRNLTKSTEEKRYEAITAYLDDALSDSARARFEAELAEDPSLQADLERERTVKQSLSQLPQRRTPRNFTLDPALFGRPAKQPLVQAYPVLRAATGLAAFFFIFALVAGLYTSGRGTLDSAGNIALFQPQTETVEVEVTRVVTEIVVEEGETVEVTVVVTNVVTETIVEEVVVEPVEEEAVEEEMAEAEEAMDEEEMAAEEEAPAEEESMENDGTGLSEADSALSEPTATAQAPIAAGGTPDDSAENEDTNLAPALPAATATEMVLPTATILPTQTALPTATILATELPPTETPLPTATVSSLPRPEASPTVVRSIETTEEAADEMAALAATEVASDDDVTQKETAVPEQDQQRVEPNPSNIYLFILIGLFLLVIVLLTLTLYTRRQL